MFVIVTQKPMAMRNAITAAIDNNEIDTWSYRKLPNNIIRFDWTGGVNDWPNLDKRVYFTATTHYPKETDNYLQFMLHTKRGHHLEDSDYARMHTELSYMLLSHFADEYEICHILPAKKPYHHADIIDDQPTKQ